MKEVAEEYGMHVLVCDPPRQERGDEGQFVTMDEIEQQCDVITFHVPLARNGLHPTYHLADEGFFNRLRRRPVIINTSRGEVVDNDTLLSALIYNKVRDAVIDTWENEPCINLRLMDKAWIATPHIAGYSADGKVNADNMVLEGLCRHFGISVPCRICPPPLPETFVPATDDDDLRLQLYNPLDDSARLKASPESFEEQRGNYPLRRESAG